MLESIFIEILNMSFIGSFVIFVVIVLRAMMKNMPKKYSYYLWAVPLIRLIIPFSFDSIVSLIPVNPEPIPQNIGYSQIPVVNTGIHVVDSSINSSLPVADAAASLNPMQILISLGIILWLIGLIAFALYGAYSFTKVKKQLENSKTENGEIYTSGNIYTAFVLGIISPKIYIPEAVAKEELEYILCHEKTHIKRMDHIFRFIAYLVLGIHWFNPLVWIAFYLSGKDMEMACDEAVIEQLGSKVKTDYSQSLLNFTTRDYKLNVSPLAFGEGNTKGRISNVLKYKEPKFYISIIGVILIIVASVMLLSNPMKDIDKVFDTENEIEFISVMDGSSGYYLNLSDGVRDEIISRISSSSYSRRISILPRGGWSYRIKLLVNNEPIEMVMSHEDIEYDGHKYSMDMIDEVITILDGVRERGEVLESGLNIYIWVNKDVTGNEEIYYTLQSPEMNAGDSYNEVYNMDIATSDIPEVMNDIKELDVGTQVNMKFVNMMPQRIIDQVSHEFIEELVGYPVIVYIVEPVELNQILVEESMEEILDKVEYEGD